ncbi:hypothetical protein CEXT_429901 [Caerostris extrusa]|uniref:Ribosomal protein S7 n=1 Tax=Caerostris extrusa TaxID=172846 RepID=A0AAV4Y4J6_CAEEX|nr:hypothetical protein CEXT_429901 [Caerostris extrusa]
MVPENSFKASRETKTEFKLPGTKIAPKEQKPFETKVEEKKRLLFHPLVRHSERMRDRDLYPLITEYISKVVVIKKILRKNTIQEKANAKLIFMSKK